MYVGNHWHRLNYSRLGQPILDPHLFGLHTHLYTVNDLSEIDLASSWGRRYGLRQRDAYFKHSNPYTAITISDKFGCNANIPNPPAAKKQYSSDPRPDIFIMEPHKKNGSGFTVWDLVLPIVEDWTFNKTGRKHSNDNYDYIFKGVWETEPGDILVLAFSLDTGGRIPQAYEDILPKPWPEIEAMLKKESSVELTGKARGFNILLFAAQERQQLRALIQKSKLFDSLRRPKE